MDRATKKLLFACRNGNAAWATEAISAGADVCATDEADRPLMALAAANGHAAIAIALLEAGAAPAGAAAEAERAGHDVLARTIRDWKPASEKVGDHIWDLEWALCKAVDQGDLRAATTLLAMAIDPSAQTQPLFPMACAARDGNLEMMRLLHAHFSLLQRPKSKSPLSWAIWTGKVAAIELLLEWGADPDAADGNGWTPMHDAAGQTRVDIAALLLAAGASPHLSDSFGNTPLSVATLRRRNTAMAKFLLARGAPVPPGLVTRLCRFAETEDADLIRVLLEAGADPAERVDGRSALEHLRARGQHVLLKLLDAALHPPRQPNPEPPPAAQGTGRPQSAGFDDHDLDFD